MKDYILIDKATGEVVSENFKAEELEDIERKQKAIEIRKSQDEFKQFVDENFKSFYFLFYKLLDKGIERQFITRFIYLCTFIDYDNKLVFGKAKGDNKYMREKDLKEVLRLGTTETIKTKNVLQDFGLLTIEENNITINNKYVVKGCLEGSRLKTSNKTRVFEEAIRELYNQITPREHKKLAVFIELLPYINLKYNIVCENPECENMFDVKPINITKLAQTLGFSTGQKLKQGLFNLKVKGEYAIISMTIDKKTMILINPRVYYKGTRLEDVKYLMGLFEAAKHME